MTIKFATKYLKVIKKIIMTSNKVFEVKNGKIHQRSN